MGDSLIDEFYPDHDRLSCSDADPCNADPAGSHGCARCTAIAMSSINGMKVRIAELEADAARTRDAIEALADRLHCHPEDAEIVCRELLAMIDAAKKPAP